MLEQRSPVEVVRRWFAALDERDANAASALVSKDCRITNPTGDDDFVGPAGARRLVLMAPPTLRRTVREEEVVGDTVVVRGLTRVPGVFANYTTWTFETAEGKIARISLAWKPAN